MISQLRRAWLKLRRRRKAYPIRKREMCVCGKMLTRKVNGEFVKHRCEGQNVEAASK